MKKRLALNITTNYFCNQKCFFCIDNTKSHLDFLKNNIDKKIYNMIDDGIGKYDNIVFTSGEPTLNKNFGNYISYARKKGYKDISMITNGSLLCNSKIREKIINSGLNELVISIHGLGSIHDNQVGVKGAFANTLKGLYNLLKERNTNLKVSLSFVLNKFNLKIFYKYINFFIGLGVNKIIVNTLRPEGYSSGYNYKKYFFKYSEFIEFIKSLKKEELLFLNSLINSNRLVITDMLYCVMSKAGLNLKGIGTVEIRKSFSSQNGYTKSFKGYNSYKTYDKILDGSIDDNNNMIKKYIEKCKFCIFKSSCEGIYIDYLNNFGDDGIFI